MAILRDWRIRNWGTKWDIGRDDGDFEIDRLKCRFTTAYCPPTPWFHHVASLYPALTLELRYEASDERLWGWMKSDGGILTVAKEERLAECEDELGFDDYEFCAMFERAFSWYAEGTAE